MPFAEQVVENRAHTLGARRVLRSDIKVRKFNSWEKVLSQKTNRKV